LLWISLLSQFATNQDGAYSLLFVYPSHQKAEPFRGEGPSVPLAAGGGRRPVRLSPGPYRQIECGGRIDIVLGCIGNGGHNTGLKAYEPTGDTPPVPPNPTTLCECLAAIGVQS